MDKIIPEIQETPVIPKEPEAISTWYITETKEGFFSSVELPWLMAQGWEVVNKERRLVWEETSTYTTITQYGYYYFMQRRSIRPEKVLDDLVVSYTDAYNEGRQLNDQRYDDALALYIAVLDATENTFNSLELDDEEFKPEMDAIIAKMEAEYEIYADNIDGVLDDFGDNLRDQLNTRFDNELTKAEQDLISRGMYNSTIWPSISVGIEKERSFALADLEDQILERQLNLEDKRHEAADSMYKSILAAMERLKDNLRAGVEMQVNIRNQVLESLTGFIERRTDSYPGLEAIGELAASLGAGSAGVYVP